MVTPLPRLTLTPLVRSEKTFCQRGCQDIGHNDLVIKAARQPPYGTSPKSTSTQLERTTPGDAQRRPSLWRWRQSQATSRPSSKTFLLSAWDKFPTPQETWLAKPRRETTNQQVPGGRLQSPTWECSGITESRPSSTPGAILAVGKGIQEMDPATMKPVTLMRATTLLRQVHRRAPGGREFMATLRGGCLRTLST